MNQFSERVRLRSGFTVVELLIAMTITLLMMAALTQTFSVLGKRMQESRADVQLSTKLRNVAFRLRDELRQRTVRNFTFDGDAGDDGYFVYYDGPASDATTTVLYDAASPARTVAVGDRIFTKWGDFDDYLAFTAMAPEGTPFTGKVPEYMLCNTDRNGDGVLSAADIVDLNGDGSIDNPVTITSDYAEIIYWASPDYVVDSADADGDGNTEEFLADPAATTFPSEPLIVPVFEDPFVTRTPQASSPPTNDLLEPMIPKRMRLHRRVLLIRPDLNFRLGDFGSPYRYPSDADTGTAISNYPNEAIQRGMLQFVETGGARYHTRPDSIPTAASTPWSPSAWLIGMCPVHQHCDLSIRRILDNNHRPTDLIAANSLADLTLPQNRFAHVRMPIVNASGGTPAQSSLPLLALGRATRLTHGDTTLSGGIYNAARGFLRPEFALGQDRSHVEYASFDWGQERRGEDVIAENLLAFDVKIFDSLAVNAILPGPDAAPGVVGTDDNQDGTTDNWQEMGSAFSDDQVIAVNDIGMYSIWTSTSISTSSERTDTSGSLAASSAFEITRGGFVDLNYMRQVGGPIRLGRVNSGSTTASNFNELRFAGSHFSGAQVTAGSLVRASSHALSGKVFGAGSVLVDQPTFDSWSPRYREPSFFIRGTAAPNVNVPFWRQSSINASVITGSLDSSSGGSSLGVDAPFPQPPEAIQVLLRVEDESQTYVKQMTVSEIIRN